MLDSPFDGSEGGLFHLRADFVIDVDRLQRNGFGESETILTP